MLALIILKKLAWLQGLLLPVQMALFLGTGDMPGYGVFSMASRAGEPTMRVGEVVLARMERYRGDGALMRGDLVLSRPRGGAKADISITRIIAIPGETVAMKDGLVSIDGRPAGRETTGTLRTASGQPATLRRETLPGGRSYLVLGDRTEGFFGNLPALKVIGRCYFTLGDNRDIARDSRFPLPDTSGFLCRERILGKPLLILWSNDVARIGTVLR